MFENLQERLQRTFKSLRGQAVLNEENMQETLRELRLALLEADVNFKIVKQFIDQVQAKSVGQQVATALSPGEQVIKIVRDELIEILGKDTARVKFASQPPTVVLMAGLQGSGKTTTSGKLAHWFKNGGRRPLLVSVDVYRPAAREQLKVVAQAIKAQIYEGTVGEANTATVERLAREARREAVNSGCDVLIVDTAGRLHIDDQLMEEMQSLKKLLNPQEILFVADAMTGQDAVNSAEEFAKKVLAGDGFSLDDFREQLRQVKKLGSLSSIVKMMPSVGPFAGMQKVADNFDDKELVRIEAIINSMTDHERDHHEVINGSRRKRIARGSGTSVQEVNQLLRQYAQMKKMFKSLSKGGGFSRKLAGMRFR